MPSIFNIGMINVSTPQQNAAVFLGELNMTGWDANMKFNTAMGGSFGIFVANGGLVNNMFDNLELFDGNIADQDVKAQIAANA